MKNYINLDGRKIEISDETAKNFREQFKEEEFDLRNGDKFYRVDGSDITGVNIAHVGRNFSPFESKNRKTLERAEAFIKLQNYADKVCVDFCDKYYYIASKDGDVHINSYVYDYSECLVKFSSSTLADQAIDYFGEDFIRLYLGVD